MNTMDAGQSSGLHGESTLERVRQWAARFSEVVGPVWGNRTAGAEAGAHAGSGG